MLNYDLVTSKARYRLPTRDDMPIFLRLVGRASAERAEDTEASAYRIRRTVRELSRRPDRGSIFLFEREEVILGYCILATGWSNAYGGEILRVDDLYMSADHRDEGIVEDFLELLCKVAPPGTCAILIEAPPGDRKAAALYSRAGFDARGERIMFKRIEESSPGSPGLDT